MFMDLRLTITFKRFRNDDIISFKQFHERFPEDLQNLSKKAMIKQIQLVLSKIYEKYGSSSQKHKYFENEG